MDRIALFLMIMMLTSCGIYKSQFDCKPGKGIGCESVSRVNQLLDEDSLDDFIAGQVKKRKCLSCGDFTKREKVIVHFNQYQDSAGRIHLAHDVQVML